MGILVHDTIPFNGLLISDVTITIKGSYEIVKSNNFTEDNQPMYFIIGRASWFVNNNPDALQVEMLRYELTQTELNAAGDLFAEIYRRLKLRYINVVDC